MDQEGKVIEIKPIAQDASTQWALLRRCPFGYQHLLAIIEALEREEAQKQEDAESVRQSTGSGRGPEHGPREDVQEQEQKDCT